MERRCGKLPGTILPDSVRVPVRRNPLHRNRSFAISLLGPAAAVLFVTVRSFAVTCEAIQFDDLKPAGQTMNWVWQSVGIDHLGNVYLVVGGERNGVLDCAFFRYNHHTGARACIGSLREIADSYDNLGPCTHWDKTEQIAKGHSGVELYDGKVYLGTKAFHDADDYSTSYRGSHIFAYDPVADVCDDLGRFQPRGVFQQHQGIDNVAAWPEYGLMVAMSTPDMDLILYDPDTREAKVVEPYGSRQNNLTREIITTPQGKCYLMAGWSSSTIKAYDIESDKVYTTGMKLYNGFCNAKAQTGDRNTIYLSTIRGNFYRLDAERETLTDLGHLGTSNTMALALGPSDEKVFAAACDNNYALYEYDIAAGKRQQIGNLGCVPGGGWFVSGSNVRTDDGYLYFGCGKSTGNVGPAFLCKVDVRDRVRVATGNRPSAPRLVARTAVPAEAPEVFDITGRNVSRHGASHARPLGVFVTVHHGRTGPPPAATILSPRNQ